MDRKTPLSCNLGGCYSAKFSQWESGWQLQRLRDSSTRGLVLLEGETQGEQLWELRCAWYLSLRCSRLDPRTVELEFSGRGPEHVFLFQMSMDDSDS